MALLFEVIQIIYRIVFSVRCLFWFFILNLPLHVSQQYIADSEWNWHPRTVGLNESWHKIELMLCLAYCTSSDPFSSWRSHTNKEDNTHIVNKRYNWGLGSLEEQTCFTLTLLDALNLNEKQSLLVHFYCQNSGYYTTDHVSSFIQKFRYLL